MYTQCCTVAVPVVQVQSKNAINIGERMHLEMHLKLMKPTPGQKWTTVLSNEAGCVDMSTTAAPITPTHLYILYLVEKPCRFFSTKSMYSGEWWKGPLSDRSQSRGPPGLSLGRLAVVAPDAITVDRKHTQQWRLRLTRPHRAIRDGGGRGRDDGGVGAWRSAAEATRH